LLALAAGIRSGRVRMSMPRFHSRATEVIAAFDRSIAQHYDNETRQRARYAVCATIDDIAQNLPGSGAHAAEWARRSLVVGFFHENISGDRFWQLVDDMLRYPNDNRDLIELCHACLAAGFEGRFRVMPDGQRRLHEIMARLQGALEHVRNLSSIEISPEWKGERAPLKRVGFWTYVGMAIVAAAGLLFLVYVVMRLILLNTGEAPSAAVAALMPDTPLRLSRPGTDMRTSDSAQAGRLKRFLEPEIRAHLVTVLEDGQTVRVRTTVGQLFKSGDDQLEPGRKALFDRIGKAIETERGPVTVEGHADSDRVSSLAFPDNMALSEARADTVAGIIRSNLSDPARVSAKGFGDSHPIATNATAAGKSQNRRVEVVLLRRY
jgi:type VI secretion system protein ImpK